MHKHISFIYFLLLFMLALNGCMPSAGTPAAQASPTRTTPVAQTNPTEQKPTPPPPAVTAVVPTQTRAPTPTQLPPTPTATAIPTPTPTMPALNQNGPMFRLILDGQPYQINWHDAALMVQGDRTSGKLVVQQQVVENFVKWFARQVNREKQAAQWHWNFTTHKAEMIRAGQSGREVDVAETVRRLSAALETGRGQDVPVAAGIVELSQAESQPPQIGDDMIIETTHPYDPASPDGYNIEQGALAINGTIVMPGEVFASDPLLYDGRKYKDAWVILGDRNSLAPGGGLCAVTTTLFQAAFWSGYEIVERYPHIYWIEVYASMHDNKSYLGLDATVGQLRFRNNTGSPLLIKTWTDGKLLHVMFIGTKPDWKVQISSYSITNEVPAPTTVERVAEPTQPEGWEEVARNPHRGLDVSITRQVIRGTQILESTTFTSKYTPVAQQVLYGTKKKG